MSGKLKKLETSLYRMVWNVFQHIKPFRPWSRLWHTTGQTDRQNGL